MLLDLLQALRPGCVAPVHVLAGRTAEERESNARYIISTARKLGCAVFVVWEDIAAGRHKAMLMLLASLMIRDSQGHQQQQQQHQEQQDQQQQAQHNGSSGASNQ